MQEATQALQAALQQQQATQSQIVKVITKTGFAVLGLAALTTFVLFKMSGRQNSTVQRRPSRPGAGASGLGAGPSGVGTSAVLMLRLRSKIGNSNRDLRVVNEDINRIKETSTNIFNHRIISNDELNKLSRDVNEASTSAQATAQAIKDLFNPESNNNDSSENENDPNNKDSKNKGPKSPKKDSKSPNKDK
jgi:hypothetical protein